MKELNQQPPNPACPMVNLLEKSVKRDLFGLWVCELCGEKRGHLEVVLIEESQSFSRGCAVTKKPGNIIFITKFYNSVAEGILRNLIYSWWPMESGLANWWVDLCVILKHSLSVFSKLHLARFAKKLRKSTIYTTHFPLLKSGLPNPGFWICIVTHNVFTQHAKQI